MSQITHIEKIKQIVTQFRDTVLDLENFNVPRYQQRIGKLKEIIPGKVGLIKGGKLKVIPETGMTRRHEKSRVTALMIK